MSKHYGGYYYTRDSVLDSAAAPGSWDNKEQYRQKVQNLWPQSEAAGPPLAVGSYAIALSSGAWQTENDALDTFFYCDGSPVSRTVYSELFSQIGTTFGEGNGSSTFNLPDFTDQERYWKTETNATLPPGVAISGQAVLPYHTHTFRAMINANSQQTSCQSPGDKVRNTTGLNNSSVGNTGSTNGNQGKHLAAVPVIAHTATSLTPIGFAIPYLAAGAEVDVNTQLPEEFYMVCSGQLLEVADYPELFKRIGTLYGASGTAFQLPDYRGIFLKATDGIDTQPVVPASPGYYEDSFAQHNHQARFRNQSASNDCPSGGDAGNGGLSGPATSNSSVGTNTENRPLNITVAWICRVQ